jgi:hypothetical protein
VGLERGPLSLGSTIEELLGRKSSGPGLQNRECGRRDPSCWPRATRKNSSLISSISGGRSVGIVRSRTQATEFVFCLFIPEGIILHWPFCRSIGGSKDHFGCHEIQKDSNSAGYWTLIPRVYSP